MPSLYHVLLLVVSFIHNTSSQLVNCNGDCNCPTVTPTPGAKCILDCGGQDRCKEGTLTCRAGDPCEIRCDDKATCSSKTRINAYQSTDVTIICGAENACKDSIQIFCGTGDCALQCWGSTACENWGTIDTSNSRSFSCIGSCPNNIPAPYTLAPTNTPSKSPSKSPTIPSNAPHEIIDHFNQTFVTTELDDDQFQSTYNSSNANVIISIVIVVLFVFIIALTLIFYVKKRKNNLEGKEEMDVEIEMGKEGEQHNLMEGGESVTNIEQNEHNPAPVDIKYNKDDDNDIAKVVNETYMNEINDHKDGDVIKIINETAKAMNNDAKEADIINVLNKTHDFVHQTENKT